MRRILLQVLFILLWTADLTAQTNTPSPSAPPAGTSSKPPTPVETFISAEYDRCGISFVLVDFDKEPRLKYCHTPFRTKQRVPDKYFDNRLKEPVWKGESMPNTLQDRIKGLPQDARPVAHTLLQSRLPHEIVNRIFASDGKAWHLDTLFKRARYNLTDDQIRILENSAQGKSAGSEGAKYSEKILKKNYIVAFTIRDIRSYQEIYDAQDEAARKTADRSDGKIKFRPVPRLWRGYKARLQSWCFKIDINDSILDRMWTFFDNPAGRDSLMYPLSLAASYSEGISVQDPIKNPVPLSEEELYNRLVGGIFSEALEKYEDLVGDFRVRAPLIGARPATAKIGLKEGLKLDSRYFVYENEVKNGRTVSVRKGVIRASRNIVDNRQENTGSTATSTFYQVAGGRLEPGMLVEQRNDNGLSLTLGTVMVPFGENVNVFNARASLNLSPLVNPDGTKKFPSQFRFIFDFDIYHKGNAAKTSEDKKRLAAKFVDSDKKAAESNALTTLGLGIGAMRDFHFLHHFHFSPFATLNYNFISYSDAVMDTLAKTYLDENYGRVVSIKLGADLGVNITHSAKLIVGIHANTVSFNPDWSGVSDSKFRTSDAVLTNRMRSTVQSNVKLRFDF